MWIVVICCALAGAAAFAARPIFADAWYWAPALAGALIYFWLLISRFRYKMTAKRLSAERPSEYTTIFRDDVAANFLRLNAELILPRFFRSNTGPANARFLGFLCLIVAAIVLAVRGAWAEALVCALLATLIMATTNFFGLREKLNRKLALRNWLTKKWPQKNRPDATSLSETTAIKYYDPHCR